MGGGRETQVVGCPIWKPLFPICDSSIFSFRTKPLLVSRAYNSVELHDFIPIFHIMLVFPPSMRSPIHSHLQCLPLSCHVCVSSQVWDSTYLIPTLITGYPFIFVRVRILTCFPCSQLFFWIFFSVIFPPNTHYVTRESTIPLRHTGMYDSVRFYISQVFRIPFVS